MGHAEAVRHFLVRRIDLSEIRDDLLVEALDDAIGGRLQVRALVEDDYIEWRIGRRGLDLRENL